MKYSTRILLYSCGVWLTACTATPDKNTSSDSPPSNSHALPVGFQEFYLKFHSDSLYQISHIVFPLKGIPDNADSLTLSRGDFHWEADQWLMQRAFDFEMSEFRREIIALNENMVREIILHQNGEFAMERRFALIGGEWHLIYYAGMNRIAR